MAPRSNAVTGNVSNNGKPGRATTVDDSVMNSPSLNNNGRDSTDLEERQRRRAFAHYDVQSLTANVGYATRLRGLLLNRRRNTATGASAASMSTTRASTPDSGDEDGGDGRSNQLLERYDIFELLSFRHFLVC